MNTKIKTHLIILKKFMVIYLRRAYYTQSILSNYLILCSKKYYTIVKLTTQIMNNNRARV